MLSLPSPPELLHPLTVWFAKSFPVTRRWCLPAHCCRLLLHPQSLSGHFLWQTICASLCHAPSISFLQPSWVMPPEQVSSSGLWQSCTAWENEVMYQPSCTKTLRMDTFPWRPPPPPLDARASPELPGRLGPGSPGPPPSSPDHCPATVLGPAQGRPHLPTAGVQGGYMLVESSSDRL